MYQKISSKNKFDFLVKRSTKNGYFRVYILYFDELQCLIKISNKITQGVKCLQITIFYKRVFGFFLIQFIARKILIYLLHRIFRFLLK